MSAVRVASALAALLSLGSGCKSDAPPPTVYPDGSGSQDGAQTDGAGSGKDGASKSEAGAAKDATAAIDTNLGDAPASAAITCSPAKAAMTKLNSVCAQASVVLDHSGAAVKCSAHEGVARTAEPMLLFTRQDDPCAGPGISEIVFFVETNKTLEFLSVAPKGVIEKSDKHTLREIPYLMVVDTTFQLTGQPTKKYWMRLRGGKDIEILGLRPL